MNAEQLWNQFQQLYNVQDKHYEAWAFGSDADLLARLVINGEKTATASAYPLYEREDEALPQVGDYSVILDSKENAICIVQTTKVYVERFLDVSSHHAYQEGEGDKSLEYWRNVHKEFFTNCLNAVGLMFDDHMKVVCEEFKVVYKGNDDE